MTATTDVLDLVGRDNSGRFRLTLVAVQSPDRWRLANAHIGSLQQPPGPPPS